MAQVLTIGVFAFLFLQLAAGQDACLVALNTLGNNVATCTATPQNPTVICEGVCRGYFDDIFTSCPAAQAAASQQAFDAACGTTQATQDPTTSDDTPSDACLAALGRLANAPASCTPTSENDVDVDAVCSGECRGFYDDVAANCPSDEAASLRQAVDAACASFTQGPATTQATQAPATTDDTPNGACLAALGRIPASCAPTSENDVDAVCSGECRGFYDDVAANCPTDENAVQTLNAVCGGAGVIKGLGIYSLMLLSVIAAVVF